jgi:hypothetical protein
MALYSGSPTSVGMDFPPAYHGQHHASAPPPPAPQSPLKSRTSRNLCQQFAATGTCANGDQCTFSHGRHESPTFARGSPAAFQSQSDSTGSAPAPLTAQQVTSPTGLRSRQTYQQPVHHQPPPPYGAAPPPPYEGVMGHASPVMMPPPPSYQEHMVNTTSHHHSGSRHDTPLQQRDQSPRGSPSREHPLGTPTSMEAPAYPVRYRHDPYSPEGSRMVSPNRRMSTTDM